MTLLAAVRRNACRLVAGSGQPPSLALVRAAKSVDVAHADACRAWDNLFARGTPSMAGAESELCLAQYFYGLATPSLARASGAEATSEQMSAAFRGAASDLMDGSTAVLRASGCIRGEVSAILRDGASSYVEGATSVLRASGAAGEHAAWLLNSAATRIGAAGSFFHTAVTKIQDEYGADPASADWDLVNEINSEFQSAKEAKQVVKEVLQNFPFEIKEKHHCSDLILTRSYEDEQIEVAVSASFFTTALQERNWAGTASDSSKDEAKPVLSLQVTVTKGASLGMFTCTASQCEVRVDSVYMRTTVKDDDVEEYQLTFEDPNSNVMLQQLVHRYLELRGITMMTANFLHQLLSNKDVFINMFWLEKLKGFLKQSAGQRK